MPASQSSTRTTSESSSSSISRGAWLALIAAFLGWMFDGFEMGLFPVIGRPALIDLLSESHQVPELDRAVKSWLGIMTAVFLIGAATGGVVFGWLGDRIGRVRAMTLSVLTYTLFMGLCGFSTNAWMMAGFRFVASLGMGGEWSLGVALVMESWPNRSRAFLAGLIGAASNVGFLTVAVVGLGVVSFVKATQGYLAQVGLPESVIRYLTVDRSGDPTGWRLLMMIGAVPALLTFFIRLMVPESEKWQESHARGTSAHWATRDMLGVVVGAIGAMALIPLWAFDHEAIIRWSGSLVAFLVALVGFLYPVIQFLQRSQQGSGTNSVRRETLQRMILGACLSGVALIGTWASIQQAPSWADELVERASADATPEYRTQQRSVARSMTTICSALGAVVGTIAAAYLGDLVGRRPAYAILCVLSLASSLALFRNDQFGTRFLLWVFCAGGMTASFYGWLPLYLPELFRTSVRATGQGFSFNFGRILAAIGALQFSFLMKNVFAGSFVRTCSTLSFVYLVGLALIWFAPETKGKPLPD